MARRLPIDRNGTSARPEISGLMLNLAVAAFIMAAYNNTFWSNAYTIFGGNVFRTAVFGAVVWALTLFTISLLGFRWFQKPVLAGLLLLSAATSYYMDNLGVMIDRDMIRNIMLTTVNESRHLMTASFITS